MHYFDPHDPYDPPEPFRSRFAAAGAPGLEHARERNLYDGELAFTDEALGALLEALDASGLRESTLVVVFGDHGEGLYDHGHMAHGLHVYDEAVRVPLVFRLPGRIPQGRVLAGPVSLVDVEPTVLELLGLPLPPELVGQSLAAALLGRADLDPARPIFLYRRHYDGTTAFGDVTPRGEKLAVRQSGWKYIEGGEDPARELYDLTADPGEHRDVLAAEPERAARLAAALHAWRDAHASADAPPPPPVGAEEAEGLRALGYVP